MSKTILPAILSLIPALVFAEYNANMDGTVSDVMTYTDHGYIYFKLENQPTSHPTCDPNYFVIDGTIPFERRQMLLSRLLTAYASKEVINIGYDKNVECVRGYIRVHRVG